MPGAGIRRLGKVLHLSKSGNLVLRLEQKTVPLIGARVCDYKLRNVGVINNVLGPINAPYASVKPAVTPDIPLSGRILYLVEKN